MASISKVEIKPSNSVSVEFPSSAQSSEKDDPKVSLAHLQEAPLFIEACCGCALLSACVSKHGFDVLPIDFQGNKHRPFVHIVELDLRKESTWEFLRFLVQSRRPFHFHAAPPCGTASRARDRPMSHGDHGPPPLRSEQHPLGFPWLTGLSLAKVNSANRIYIQLAAFCMWFNSLGLSWSIENPGNSYLWSIDEYAMLKSVSFFVLFHSCIHGGMRKKLTAFMTNLAELTRLSGLCQDDHEHLEWGQSWEEGKLVFDTSREAAYPKVLCENFADILLETAKSRDLRFPSQTTTDVDARVASGKQPRGRRLAPLVPEFHYVKTVRVLLSDQPSLDHKGCLLREFHDIPVGSKQLRVAKAKRGESGSSTMMQLRVFGVYRCMLSFYNLSKEVMHPFDTFRGLPDHMLRVLCHTLSCSPLEIMRKRLDKIKVWRQWAKDLQKDNSIIFDNMDPGCAAVLKGKHLALLEKLATTINWPDATIHEDIRSGFKLVGMQKPTGVFAADIKPRTLSVAELEAQMQFIRPALWRKIQTENDTEYCQELWDITMEEVTKKKWLQGPYESDELDVLFESQWLPVRRFAVWQRSKWRPIDDFSECGVNSSYAYFEKIDLKALDEVIWIASCFTKFCRHEKRYDFVLSSGDRMCGEAHCDWTSMPPERAQVVAKTVDLQSAYKQFAIRPDNRRFSVLSLKCPKDGKTKGFVSRTLPFGSVASVLHFNRIARLLHRLGLELDISWANYYDDFPVIDFKFLSAHTEAAIRTLTSLLGFTCSLDKELPFNETAEMLGVNLDLSSSSAGIVKISNKADRLQQFVSAVEEILQAGSVNPRQLPSLFGRVLFVESQLMGRSGRLALSELRVLERTQSKQVKLGAVQIRAFELLWNRYKSNVPRTLKCLKTEPPVVVFTDGACELRDSQIVCTIGGVLFDPKSSHHPKCLAVTSTRLFQSSGYREGRLHLSDPIDTLY